MKKIETKTGEVLNLENEVAMCRDFDVKWIHRIVAGSGMNRAGSWGFRNGTEAAKDQAYRFRVSGHHHKGFVYIVLAANDTFTVFLTSLQNKVKKRLDNIYIDMLIETLDVEIERIDIYKQ
jgi:hypothetical protein